MLRVNSSSAEISPWKYQMLLHKTTKELIDFKLDLQFHKEYFSIYTLDGYSFIILRTEEVGLKYLITYRQN